MKKIEQFINAMVIDWARAASIKGDYMASFEAVNAFRVTGSPYDNDGNPIYIPAQDAAEAPQDADQDQPTEATETAQDAAGEAQAPNLMTEIENTLDAIRTANEEIKALDEPENLQKQIDSINWTLPRVDWEARITAAIIAAQDIAPASAPCVWDENGDPVLPPLQLETIAARLNRMTAAELVSVFISTSAPATIDDDTDDAIYSALEAINPRAYRAWMDSTADSGPGDPASIAAANTADIESLRTIYAV